MYMASAFLALIGITFIVLALVVPGVVDDKLNKAINEKVVVDSTSHEDYDDWLTNLDADDSPEYLRIYAWNITNMEKAVDGEKMNLEQVGPYVYRQRKVKLDVTFGDDVDDMNYDEGELVRYKLWKYWVFDREETAASLDPINDQFVTVNLIYAAVVANVDIFLLEFGTESVLRVAGQRYFFGDDGFETRSFEDLAFRGPSPIIPNVTSADEAREKFAFDVYTTGRADVNDRGRFVQWQEQSVVEDTWLEPQPVVGRTGTEWPRNLTKNSEIVTWQPDLVRQIPLINDDGETVDLFGIKLLRHRVDTTWYQDASTNPNNAKYLHVEDPDENGVIPLSTLKLGVPIFVSIPWFYSANRETVAGSVSCCDNPDPDIHASIIDVDPITGATMYARRRVQVNIKIGPTDTFAYRNLREAYMPILWYEEAGGLTKSLANDYKKAVYGAIELGDNIEIAGAVLGPVFLVSSVFVGVLAFRRRQFQSHGMELK